MSATRIPHTPVLLAGRVIAVLRAEHASEYPRVIDSLIRGGVTSIELTLSTRGVFEQLPALVAHVGAVGEVGVGTVTTNTSQPTRPAGRGSPMYSACTWVALRVTFAVMRLRSLLPRNRPRCRKAV